MHMCTLKLSFLSERGPVLKLSGHLLYPGILLCALGIYGLAESPRCSYKNTVFPKGICLQSSCARVCMGIPYSSGRYQHDRIKSQRHPQARLFFPQSLSGSPSHPPLTRVLTPVSRECGRQRTERLSSKGSSRLFLELSWAEVLSGH